MEAEYRSLILTETRVLGAEDPETLKSRRRLAYALSRQKKLAEAEEECLQVLPLVVRVFGAEDMETLKLRELLAGVLQKQNKQAHPGR